MLPAIPPSQDAPIDLRAVALQTLAQVQKDYYDPERKVYRLWLKADGSKAEQAAFLWDMSAMLLASARLEPGQHPSLPELLEVIEPYRWENGYSVLPAPSPRDRYYDDNAWLVLAILDAYERDPSPELLDRAKLVFTFLEEGESSELGGGLFWKENGRESKNTCINAPGIVAALRLHKITKEPSYRLFALRTYRWIRRLQDEDGLYWDNIHLNGRIEKTKWSYNTALMIEAELLLAELEHKQKHRDEALRMGQAATHRWIDPDTGAIRDHIFFAMRLNEAFAKLAAVESVYRDRVVRAATALARDGRGARGLFSGRWDRAPRDDEEMLLLNQGSAIRALLTAAELAK